MDFCDVMWDSATRDLQSERNELARTAALTDAETVWPLVAGAVDERDLGYRLQLADNALRTIATRRGYEQDSLRDDLVTRWRLLAESRAMVAPTAAPTAEAWEAAMDRAITRLATKAARENPRVPMHVCLSLAAEAVRKIADASPLAWESWGHVADGPFTQRMKNWQPPSLKTPPELGGKGEIPTLKAPPRTPPRVTPEFSHAPEVHTPVPNPGERPAPPSFSDRSSVDDAMHGPVGTTSPSFSDTSDTHTSPGAAGTTPSTTFSDTGGPDSPPPPAAAPAVGGFSNPAPTHIAPRPPSGPPSMPTFSG
jgi:hypothetical protein